MNIDRHTTMLSSQATLTPSYIADRLEQLTAVALDLVDVWLIGSRANGREQQNSDWDFLAFGTQRTLSTLQSLTQFHYEDWDFLVVTDGNKFQAAWGPGKRGDLMSWQWRLESAQKASYQGLKWVESEDLGGVEKARMQARRVWSRNAT